MKSTRAKRFNKRKASGPKALRGPQMCKEAVIRLGFERGLTVESILSMHQYEGSLFFLVRWDGSDLLDLISAQEAYSKIPQKVIEFYEELYVSRYLS